MIYNTDVMHERPFQKVGGIEKAFGVRNKDVVRDFINRELSVIQENPQRSEFALAQDLLTPTDELSEELGRELFWFHF